MAVTLEALRTIINEADATTGWTGTNSVGVNTASPTPVEATSRLEMQVSNATQDAYFTVSSVDLTNQVIYIWFSHRAEFDTLANVGVGIQIGDGTNRVAYGIIGSDAIAFSHFEGPVVWQCLVLDVANRAAYPSVTIAGSAGSLNVAAITQIGLRMKTIVKSIGGAVNCFWDISRRLDKNANNGCAIGVIGGTSGSPGTFEEIAAADRATGNQQAYGIVRKLGAGLYGVQGPLRFGNSTGTASSWFEVKNISVAFEDRKLSTDVYRIVIVDNGTGTTTFKLGTKVGSGITATGADGCNFIISAGVGGLFDAATDTDVTDVFIYGSNFRGWEGGMSFRAGHEFIGGVISQSGAVNSGGATFVNSFITQPTVAADASGFIWNVATDPDGYMDGMVFSKGTNAHHAIEFGTTSPTSITLRGIDFTGFSATNNANDSTFHVKRTTGTVTINVVNCSGNFGYRTDGATVVIVANPVTLEVTVLDGETQSPISGARVYVPVTNGVNWPYLASVSITGSGTTATVTHTSHGLKTNDNVVIKGANQDVYNGVYAITVTGTNTYTYTTNETIGGSPATGTITSTFVLINGTTNGSGVISDTRTYSNDQPIGGWARKSTSAPYYRQGAITDTVDSATGKSITLQLISDE